MPSLSKYIPSMFQRRVFLLAVMAVGAFVLLVVRLGWMTLGAGGEQARIDAARLLVRETWLPTVRGTIFDRKGRVIAGDRASYDIAVDYRVLAGQWVYEGRSGKLYGVDIPVYARRLAKRYNADIWDRLEESQQDEIVADFESAMHARIDVMYQFISTQTGMPIEELMAQRDEIIKRVSRIKGVVSRDRYAKMIRGHEERGHVPNEDDIKRANDYASQPIAAEEVAHTLVGDVSDELGFIFIRQSVRLTALVVTGDEPDGNITPVFVFPGLTVVDATTRIYPYSDLTVMIDRSSFPPPIQSDRSEQIRVTDIGSMILGSVRSGIQGWVDDDGEEQGDRPRRRQAIQDDLLLRARSVTSKGTDRGRYITGDRVGRTGIEKAYEDHLRGLRGVTVENKQTNESLETLSTPGLDIELTLDIMLQARVRAILEPSLGLARVQPWHHNEEPTLPIGTELDAGVIVLEVATGDILAMVSTPVPPTDGDWSKYGVRDDAAKRRFDVTHTPYVNRAIAMPYPPGSVAKALILNGAAKYGVYQQGDRIEATGHLLPNQPNKYRSWIFKNPPHLTHYEQLERHPDGVDALMVSSNVFFFTLGRRLDVERISAVYHMFGVGTPYNLGIGQEWAGSVEPFNGVKLNIEHATLMGIGQGPVTWTPLHAADAFATIARQGYRIAPKLIRDGRAPIVTDIGLPAWSVRDALEGLDKVVNNRRWGSGFGIRYQELEPHTPTFNAPGIQVWGKTGTADAPAIFFDPDKVGDDNGPMEPFIVRDGDHSWYVTLVGREGGSPEYAIAVVVDYAGSGGRVSGPINNQIIHALIAEGYLPKVESQEVSP